MHENVSRQKLKGFHSFFLMFGCCYLGFLPTDSVNALDAYQWDDQEKQFHGRRFCWFRNYIF
jgi:hypothetical protein